MPDFNYTDPFSKVGQSLQASRARPPVPTIPGSRPSLFDDPRMRRMVEQMNAGERMTGMPGDLAPVVGGQLSGDAPAEPVPQSGPSPGRIDVRDIDPKSYAPPPSGPSGGFYGRSGVTPDEPRLIPPGQSSLVEVPGGWTKQEWKGGTGLGGVSDPKSLIQQIASPAKAPKPDAPMSRTEQWMQGLQDQASQPVWTQDWAAPHRQLGIDTATAFDSPADAAAKNAGYQAKLDASKMEQQGYMGNVAAQMGGRQQAMNALTELLKAQTERQPTSIQQQQLALEQQKQKFIEGEAARLKGDEPRRLAMEDKLTADIIAKNPGMSAEEAAARAREQASRIFTGTKPAAATPGTATPGVTSPVQGAVPTAKAPADRSYTDFEKSLPRQLRDLTATKTDQGKPQTTPEAFMTAVYKMDQTSQLPPGVKMADLIGFMEQQYGKEAVAKALKPGHLGAIDAEMFHSGLSNFSSTLGLGNKEESQAPYQAQAAFRNALGRGKENRTPNMSALEWPGAMAVQGSSYILDQLRKLVQ